MPELLDAGSTAFDAFRPHFRAFLATWLSYLTVARPLLTHFGSIFDQFWSQSSICWWSFDRFWRIWTHLNFDHFWPQSSFGWRKSDRFWIMWTHFRQFPTSIKLFDFVDGASIGFEAFERVFDNLWPQSRFGWRKSVRCWSMWTYFRSFLATVLIWLTELRSFVK